jgi:hypothetical protein
MLRPTEPLPTPSLEPAEGAVAVAVVVAEGKARARVTQAAAEKAPAALGKEARPASPAAVRLATGLHRAVSAAVAVSVAPAKAAAEKVEGLRREVAPLAAKAAVVREASAAVVREASAAGAPEASAVVVVVPKVSGPAPAAIAAADQVSGVNGPATTAPSGVRPAPRPTPCGSKSAGAESNCIATPANSW